MCHQHDAWSATPLPAGDAPFRLRTSAATTLPGLAAPEKSGSEGGQVSGIVTKLWRDDDKTLKLSAAPSARRTCRVTIRCTDQEVRA